ncbi:MAG TPA: NmrA/HSCARG family protein [Gaiellales bacterium]
MSDKKVIAVVGATGAQGGGLVRAIMADPDGGFTARALTRDPSSEAAQALAALGAEVVQVDIDDAASVRSAFEGAYGAFCVTFFWAHFSPATEQAQVENMIAAATAGGLRHVIWSTLEDTRELVPLEDDRMPTLQDAWKVPHFDSKGSINHLFTDAGLPTTFLQTAFYWENFIYFGMGPQRGEDGALSVTFPLGGAKMPSMGAEDIGKAAYGVFKGGEQFIGTTVSISSDHLGGADFAAGFAQALGEDVSYNEVSPDAYRGFGFPGADDLGNMFQYKRDFESEYRSPRDVDATRALNPELQTFEQWLADNIERVPVPPKT